MCNLLYFCYVCTSNVFLKITYPIYVLIVLPILWRVPDLVPKTRNYTIRLLEKFSIYISSAFGHIVRIYCTHSKTRRYLTTRNVQE